MSWKAWFMLIAAILVLGPVGYGIYLERQFLPFVGISWLMLMGAAPGFLVVVGLIWLLKFILRVEWRDVGEFGTIGQWFHHLKEYSPKTAISPASEKEKEKPAIQVPTVTELLKEGLLGTLDLLLGFTQDGKPYWGSWASINTFCIAGKSRSGKTITLFFIILQAVLNGAVVRVIDPHGAGRKQSALRVLLQPLAQWVIFAVTPDEIEAMADEFYDILQGRVDNKSDDNTPQLLAIDEFNGVAEDIPRLYEIVNKCAREWAGVNGFAAIAGHEWTAAGKGKALLVTMRRNLHAKFVHRLDEGYAKFLLNSGKVAKTTEKLRTGCNYFQDVEGEIIQLKTPLGVTQDAITVAEKLMQLAGPEYQPQLMPGESESFNPEIMRFIRAEISNFKSDVKELPEKSTVETENFREPEPDVTTYEGRKMEVARLRALGFIKQGELLELIWKVKPGNTKEYKDARAEYQRILIELATRKEEANA